MATNQPIPFKERSSTPSEPRPSGGEDPQVPGKPATGAARPPGEVGGHTVQPWEQDRQAPTTSTPSSKDVPPPQQGADEARAAGTGPGLATTQAPYNLPSSKPAGVDGGTGGGPGDGDDEDGGEDGVAAQAAGEHAGAGAGRPNRPPVYSPQQGHEPAPRPPPGHVPGGLGGSGLGTEGDRLVAAIVQAISENIGKAFHQSVAQAVREVMPLSARSVDRGLPAKPNGPPRSPALDAARGGVAQAAPSSVPPVRREATPAAGAKRSDAGTGQHDALPGAEGDTAAPESPGPTGSRPTGMEPAATAATAAGGPRPSQYGGTIEAPDQEAIEKAKRADGGPAAAAADEAKRGGGLV